MDFYDARLYAIDAQSPLDAGRLRVVAQWRIASPCQEFREGAEILRVWLSGNERALVLSDEPVLLDFQRRRKAC
jgi:hypothetical protein